MSNLFQRCVLSDSSLIVREATADEAIGVKKGGFYVVFQPPFPVTNVPINIRLANINITHRQPIAQNLSDLDHSMLLQVKSDCAVGLPMYCGISASLPCQ